MSNYRFKAAALSAAVNKQDVRDAMAMAVTPLTTIADGSLDQALGTTNQKAPGEALGLSITPPFTF